MLDESVTMQETADSLEWLRKVAWARAFSILMMAVVASSVHPAAVMGKLQTARHSVVSGCGHSVGQYSGKS